MLPHMPDLSPELRRGAALFNAGDWWEAHEAWEDVWRTAQGEKRAFVQALILLSAALHKRWHHGSLTHRNFYKAEKYLDTLPDHYGGVNLRRLREEVRQALDTEGMRPQLPLSPGNRPTALITGASGGLGTELARQLAALGADLLLTAPEREPLDALAAELRERGVWVGVLALDLTAPDASARLEAHCQRHGLTVDLLINNAGIGDFGPFVTLDRARQQQMIALNMAALTDLTHRFLPGMVQRGRGRVLNVASTAAFMPSPPMTVYAATKAYILSFSEALQEEVRGTGVQVTALCPGPMRTAFAKQGHMEENAVFGGGFHEILIVEPREAARQGIEAMLLGRSVQVVGRVNRLTTLLPRLAPRDLLARIVRRVQTPAD